jgi:hypothetical protein
MNLGWDGKRRCCGEVIEVGIHSRRVRLEVLGADEAPLAALS